MRYRTPAALAFLLLAVLTPRAHGQLELTLELQSAIAEAGIGAASVSVSIRDAATNVELVGIDGDRLMIPASNMKLLTTGAALHVLGEDFAFRTRMVAADGVITILGAGDPAFGDPELLELMTDEDGTQIDLDGFLDNWVDAVAESGMTSIDAIVVDDRVFDRERVHPTWPADQLTRPYCAEVAGMGVHLNTLHVFPRPTDGARPSIASVVPGAPWLDPRNEATCRRGVHDDSTAWITRGPETNDFRLYGNVKFGYREPLRLSIHDPALFAGRLLADRIRRRGIEVGDARVVAADAPPSVAGPLGPVIATPISTVVTRCNRDSENLYAEALIKRIGHESTGRPGSWLNGAAIVRHVVHQRLRQPELSSEMVVADGSGLSRDNRISAQAMTAWLNTFHRDETLGPVFIASLAEARVNGTMKKRFGSTDLHGALVQAKSGYINHVSCLSGYVTAPGGERRSFSILVNDLTAPGSVRAAKRMQERIVSIVAREMKSVEVTLGSD